MKKLLFLSSRRHVHNPAKHILENLGFDVFDEPGEELREFDLIIADPFFLASMQRSPLSYELAGVLTLSLIEEEEAFKLPYAVKKMADETLMLPHRWRMNPQGALRDAFAHSRYLRFLCNERKFGEGLWTQVIQQAQVLAV